MKKITLLLFIIFALFSCDKGTTPVTTPPVTKINIKPVIGFSSMASRVAMPDSATTGDYTALFWYTVMSPVLTGFEYTDDSEPITDGLTYSVPLLQGTMDFTVNLSEDNESFNFNGVMRDSTDPSFVVINYNIENKTFTMKQQLVVSGDDFNNDPDRKMEVYNYCVIDEPIAVQDTTGFFQGKAKFGTYIFTFDSGENGTTYGDNSDGTFVRAGFDPESDNNNHFLEIFHGEMFALPAREASYISTGAATRGGAFYMLDHQNSYGSPFASGKADELKKIMTGETTAPWGSDMGAKVVYRDYSDAANPVYLEGDDENGTLTITEYTPWNNSLHAGY